jgi:beta-xylosidase
VALHGFPLDWNHWTIHEWPDKLREIQAVTSLPIWVTEVGVSTFGADEVQEFGLRRTAELLLGRVPRVHWYSLCDLPRAWPATTRHREAEGSSYYRHFYLGLLREDGTPKPAAAQFAQYAPAMGICQWFHFEDRRLDDAVRWLRKLGVRHLRTGLSWADSQRPGAETWFDRQMRALEPFDVTLTFCFTPESSVPTTRARRVMSRSSPISAAAWCGATPAESSRTALPPEESPRPPPRPPHGPGHCHPRTASPAGRPHRTP